MTMQTRAARPSAVTPDRLRSSAAALRRRASPLLRYLMGDLVEVTGADCACGRTGVRIAVLGRADDMLIVRGVNVFPAAVKDVVGGFFPRATGRMRIRVDGAGHSTDRPLDVLVEHAPELAPDAVAALTGALADRIHARLGVRAAVAPVPPGVLGEPGAGKEVLVERGDGPWTSG